MNEDKIIAEALGLCWHEWLGRGLNHKYCPKCGIVMNIDYEQIEFDTPDGFFRIMELGRAREWWKDFLNSILYAYCLSIYEKEKLIKVVYLLPIEYIDPPKMKSALAEFLRKEK